MGAGAAPGRAASRAELAALARAGQLALRGRFEVEPNPLVGAVVLAGGEIVGEGWHQAFGGPHAEIEALSRAGERADGSTLVVTLEPCRSQGKTGPCTAAVLAAGVRRLVVGAVDPDPRHGGRGLLELRAAGVDVVSVADEQAAGLLRRFELGLGRGRPWLIAKWAMSADGRVAGPDGRRVTISSPASLQWLHRWRAHLDALIVGVGTVVADDPLLTARGPTPATRPLRRVVLDPTLRTPLGCRLVVDARESVARTGAGVWIVGQASAAPERVAALRAAGVTVVTVPVTAGESDLLPSALAALAAAGARRVMLEGGPTTWARAWAADLVDQVTVVRGPHELGPAALPAHPTLELGGLDPGALAARLELTDIVVESAGPDTVIRGDRRRVGSGSGA